MTRQDKCYNYALLQQHICHVKHVYAQPYLKKEEAIWGQKREYFNVPICHIPLTAYISLSFVFLMLADKKT